MNWFKIVVMAALLLCLLPMPYGYYMLVRVAAMVAFGMMARACVREGRTGPAWACLAAVVLFQPFVKIPLGRPLWACVDVAAALFIACDLWRIRRHNGD